MVDWQSYSYLLFPLAALAIVGCLSLLLAWTFRRGGSLVQRSSQAGFPGEYGLLAAVAEPRTYVEAEILRRKLMSEGLRATVAMTVAGPRVLVWPDDEQVARRILAAAKN